MERSLPIRHRPSLSARLVPHLLSVAIALMAIVALPLCLPHEAAPGLDADARTITESRDVVEIVTTPGVHLLHQAPRGQVADACNDCAVGAGSGSDSILDGDEAAHTNEPRVPHDDVSARVAVMPVLDAVTAMGGPDARARSDRFLPGAMPPGESPPPRLTPAST